MKHRDGAHLKNVAFYLGNAFRKIKKFELKWLLQLLFYVYNIYIIQRSATWLLSLKAKFADDRERIIEHLVVCIYITHI